MFGFIRRWGVRIGVGRPPPWRRRPDYDDDYYHRHHDRRPRGIGVGGVIGGIIGGILGSQSRQPEPEPEPEPPKPDNTEVFDKAMHFVTSVPEGVEVRLTLEEFRAIVDRAMVTYINAVPYCLGRKISVVEA